jgi:hypothetical protein
MRSINLFEGIHINLVARRQLGKTVLHEAVSNDQAQWNESDLS